MASGRTLGEKEVDDFLGAVPEPQQSTLRELRAMLKKILPDGEEKIHYGVPAIQINGKSIAGYASAKRHCSYYPHSGALLETLADSLTKYDYSKGTLHFPVDKCLPISLVRKLVKARLEQLGVN
ncbi:MAG: hypothetical protein F2612_04755 [Actinobacteria bacterium]|uniref:Unannotated protein n=1 Tax=freshwater metagenome TaxID=449393 RepID=A0A6J6JX25_9ZZZZ|nr:hypothetical protein [Actinomycetota bacterium]